MAKKSNPRRQLGQGVRALLGNIDTESGTQQEELVKKLSSTVAPLPIEMVHVNPYNPRREFDSQALEELAASIRIHGLIQPITVRRINENEYQLISGERRLRASQMAGLKEVPAYIRLANDQESLEMALVENIQREDLNAIEIAITYSRLKEECNLTDMALSERVGKGRSTITNYLQLLKLPEIIQEGISDGQISMGHARELSAIGDYAFQKALFQDIINHGLSVRATEQRAKAWKSKQGRSTRSRRSKGLPEQYARVQDQLRQHPGIGGLSIKLSKDNAGQLVIPFRTLDEFNHLIELLDQ